MRLFLLLFGLALPLAAPADTFPYWVALHAGSAKVSIPDANLNNAQLLMLEVGQRLHPNFALEGGMRNLRNITETGTDDRGDYTLELTSNDFFVGGRAISAPVWQEVQFYASLGILFNRLRVRLNESFYDIKPGGTAEVIETSWGTFVNAGAFLPIDEQIDLHMLYSYRMRFDAFDTFNGARDMHDHALSLGLSYRF